MANFQLVDDPLLLKKSWMFSKGTRLFVFGDSGDEKITIHLDQEIQLDEVGMISTAAGRKVLPKVVSSDEAVVKVVKTTQFEKLERQTITLKAKGAGKAELRGEDPAGNVSTSVAPLKVVVGDFKNHTNMKTDLLADVCRGSNVVKIHAIHRMLNNNEDNIFNENSKANVDKMGPRACGSVTEYGTDAIWGGKAGGHQFVNYHTPLSPSAKITNRANVKFDEKTTKRATTTLARWLRSNKFPVEVGVIYGPSSTAPASLDQGGALTINKYGQIERTGNSGHSVLIVGCSEDEKNFLYVDPWFNGSKMVYGGGVSIDKFTNNCEDMGIFTLVNDPDRGPLLRQSSLTEGTFKASADDALEIISGP